MFNENNYLYFSKIKFTMTLLGSSSYPKDLPTQSTLATNEYPGELSEAGG